ncbi:uncharacterized protein LOC105688183 [Athalia rosae]|uniref:uncharacterized protein LOC105688183 n=1 Tax=Athalia rosae TaxID=37344 RepID=UPI00203327F3|nr:uncharacterized protein LOC105688183 [Athalia rosae]XP_012259714.2 uncharacterized protein LOC105688183 [Athalia rosae]XP_048515622.1 uncharacterized protein LOC105688183 [Athalia rosae]XP_048515623.1 uncharacterized protein LOC105688183 [Athalia rosae]
MGQAWCKERTTKAQDSKSPLDRVFVRCAHQIYPTLKQDGSVLGGATQRVTSSEIGYAGSPPREVLARGQSVDSIDRPFHPSEWVDVNLEVPSVPSSAISNRTADTNVYSSTTFPSSDNGRLTSALNLKNNITPIPPPRRRRKNRGRPLPPKPYEIIETHGNGTPAKSSKKIEPLYSSVKSPRSKENKSGDRNSEGKTPAVENDADKKEDSDEKEGGKNDGEGNEEGENNGNKVNVANGRILPTIDVTESEEPEKCFNQKSNKNGDESESGTTDKKDEDYEKFSKSREILSSSTPNGPSKVNSESQPAPRKDLGESVNRTVMEEDDLLNIVYHRPKNYSTVSLPNYDELEVVKKEVQRAADEADSELVTPKKPDRARHVSTNSLPIAEELFSSLPQGVTDRLEKYMTRCRSFGSLQSHEILDKIKSQVEENASSDEDDHWGGLDDWDLGVVDCEPSDGRSPLEPNSRLRERKEANSAPIFKIGESDVVTTRKGESRTEVVVSPGKNADLSAGENEAGKKDADAAAKDEKKPLNLSIPRNASFEAPKSPNSLKSALKAEAKRKISMPVKLASEKPSHPLEDWFSGQERSVRFFDVPKVEEEYANTPGHRPSKPPLEKKAEAEYDDRSYPFNSTSTAPLNIDTFFGADEDFGGAPITNSNESRTPKSLTRSLSNESEPFDGYESKELTLGVGINSQSARLTRTISDESIPPDMAGDDSSSERNSLNSKNGADTAKGSRESKTPPPSPEPKIRAEIFGTENLAGARPTSLKIQRDFDDAGSNVSSMTPSLTELEAALSDMLERDDQEEQRSVDDHVDDSKDSNLTHSESAIFSTPEDKPIEPKILQKSPEELIAPGNNGNVFVRRRKENAKISLGQILDSSSGTPGSNKSESFGVEIVKSVGKNPFEDDDYEIGESLPRTATRGVNPFDDEPPEKPSRLHKTSDNVDVPTPPQRKNKHGATSPTSKSGTPDLNDSEFPIGDASPHPNDRLI